MVFLNHEERALLFKKLHRPGDPLILVNIWDAGSAKVVTERGVKALGTSSLALAESFGYADGENIPLRDFVRIVGRIAATSNLPLSVDVEGGYGQDTDAVEKCVLAVVEAGAVGITIEDGMLGGRRTVIPAGLHRWRIKAARHAADRLRKSLFINARIDTYVSGLGGAEAARETLRRAKIYRDAGADGIFVPGLSDPAVIERLVAEVALPINVLLTRKMPSVDVLGELGVARVSVGTAPFEFFRTSLGSAVSSFNRTRSIDAFAPTRGAAEPAVVPAEAPAAPRRITLLKTG